MVDFRDTWWKNIGIPSKTDARRKRFVGYFFTGTKNNLSAVEQEELEGILYSPLFQQQYCDYLIHTSK